MQEALACGCTMLLRNSRWLVLGGIGYCAHQTAGTSAAVGGEVDYTEHIAPLRAAAPASMRCVLVSATLPQHTFDELQDLFMGLGAAFGPGLHRTAQGERVCRSVAGKAAAQLVNSSL